MSKKHFLNFHEPFDITEEQRKINEQEWNNPENWRGHFFPSYSSKLDNRPIVPGNIKVK
jgi:hypothetical protein